MIPASRRSRAVSSAAAPAISQMPVAMIVSRGHGTQPGTIGRNASGERRWMIPTSR